MESKYFGIIQELNKKIQSGIMSKVANQKTFEAIRKSLMVMDKNIITVFKGGTVQQDKEELEVVTRGVDIMLSISLEKPLSDDVSEVVTLILQVMSLWNMHVYKNDRIETRVAASVRLLQCRATIADLIYHSQIAVSRMKAMNQLSPAFDVARHYKMAQEEAEEEKGECPTGDK